MKTDFVANSNDIPWYKINPKDCSELVLIPGGWFWMGSGEEDSDAADSEKPRHLHYVAPFYLGIACVTVAQFKRFLKEAQHDAGKDWQKDPEEHPVRSVNWHEASAYCQWAGLRLPTEAEWELSARGYGALKYPWGGDWEDGRRVCWSNQKGPKGSTAPVYSHPEGVSRFGSFQQSGNMWEWCADTWDAKAYERYARGDFNPSSQDQFWGLRGGSWGSVSPRPFWGAYRNYGLPDGRYDDYGFRVAGTVTF